MADRKSSDVEALKLLVEAGVIDRKVTLDDLMRLSSRLEEVTAGDPGGTSRWQFIVKNRFVWTDDSPAAAVAKSVI